MIRTFDKEKFLRMIEESIIVISNNESKGKELLLGELDICGKRICVRLNVDEQTRYKAETDEYNFSVIEFEETFPEQKVQGAFRGGKVPLEYTVMDYPVSEGDDSFIGLMESGIDKSMKAFVGKQDEVFDTWIHKYGVTREQIIEGVCHIQTFKGVANSDRTLYILYKQGVKHPVASLVMEISYGELKKGKYSNSCVNTLKYYEPEPGKDGRIEVKLH